MTRICHKIYKKKTFLDFSELLKRITLLSDSPHLTASAPLSSESSLISIRFRRRGLSSKIFSHTAFYAGGDRRRGKSQRKSACYNLGENHQSENLVKITTIIINSSLCVCDSDENSHLDNTSEAIFQWKTKGRSVKNPLHALKIPVLRGSETEKKLR